MIEVNKLKDIELHIDDVSCVIFDLDDTLYNEKDYVRSGYRKIASYLGNPQIEEEMWQVFLRGGKAIDEVLETRKLMSHKDEALAVYRNQIPDISLDNEVMELLKRLSATKKLGIITDGRPEGQRAKIEALGLCSLGFARENIIITDELGGVHFRKPAPDAFVIMKDRLQASFSEMVYIGDNINKDFVSPNELGMKSIWYKNPQGLYFKA